MGNNSNWSESEFQGAISTGGNIVREKEVTEVRASQHRLGQKGLGKTIHVQGN